MDAQLQREIDELGKELRRISSNAKNQTSRILGKGARPLVYALFAAAPHGRKMHKRYSAMKGRRAKRGSGNVVATYAPGNLAASFAVMRFRNAKYRVTVGAKLAKGSAQGNFGPMGKSDGYYAHMVEKGTKNSKAQPFVLPTWIRMEPTVKNIIIADFKRVIKRLKK